MDHITEWKRINAARDRRRESESKQRAKEEKERIIKIKAFLAKHGAENVSTNGYVWDFDYKGMSGHFCDQTDRVVGAIHRPFMSEEDRKCYQDMETDMMRGEAHYFISEYCYHDFCINGKPWRSLHRVFRLIENVIAVRRLDSP